MARLSYMVSIAFMLTIGSPINAASDISASLVVRFALDRGSIGRNRDYLKLVGSTSFEFNEKYFSPNIPAGPVIMACDSVEVFGITYALDGHYDKRVERPQIRVRVTHPELKSKGWRFSHMESIYKHLGSPRNMHSSSFSLKQKDRVNGVFTLKVSYKGRVLVSASFELVGCDQS